MPSIKTGRRKQPAIGDLRDAAYICTWVERPDDDISVVVRRPGVFTCMAKVLPVRGSQVMDYQVIWGEKAPTHEVTIRCPPDVHLALNHWIYVETKFGRTWYRIRNIEDLGGVRRFYVILCSQDTIDDNRTDPATQLSDPVFEVPDRI